MRVKDFSSFTASEEIGTCTLRVTILLLTTLGYCFQSLKSYASYFLMQLITKEPILRKASSLALTITSNILNNFK